MKKVGPPIIATETIRDPSDITDSWKIAAIEGRHGWEWLCGYSMSQQISNRLFSERDGPPRTLSGVRGYQKWDGQKRLVLYVRNLPPGVE